eukprot:PhF_6_TR34948/c0_g1_i1/m.50675/K01866/YARS, tyrS; tyrosyl-tRNA synthetase
MTTLSAEYENFAQRLMYFNVAGASTSSKPQQAPSTKADKPDTATPAATPAPPAPVTLSPEVQRKVNSLLLVGEECQTVPELENLLTKKENPICYDGFEPSGRMHIAQGVFKAINVNRCAAAGCTFVFWVADWFALMNDKMGGELEKIHTVGKYFIEVWRASGMDMKAVKFQWASQDINRGATEYWTRVMDIARKSSISRITKCCQIMGRKEGSLTSAQILYPLMQCSDIFFLKADICQLGVDQRKVNMLARDYCDQIGRKLKPIVLSHHMLQGLAEIRDDEGNLVKMSKSNADSAVFMEDTVADVNRKIMQAYCPKSVKENPCLDYIRNIVFGKEDKFMSFSSYQEVEEAFLNGSLDEFAMKEALAAAVNKYIEPVRKHFDTDPDAKALLEKVRAYKKDAPAPAAEEAPPAAVAPHTVAWLYPTLHVTLRDALHIVRSLNAAVARGEKATLVLADWTAFCNNHIVGEEKDINSVLDYSSMIVQAYGLDSKVTVVKQSAVILADSDTYWLRVIEVGRKNTLSQVEAALGQAIETAGQVVSVLMHTADVYVLKATSVVGDTDGVTPGMNDFAVNYMKKFASVQSIVARDSDVPNLSDPTQAVVAGSNVGDSILFADDVEADVKKKVKRAFGPPAQIDNNPLIPLAAAAIAIGGKLVIQRPAEHGGDKSFDSVAGVKGDYQSAALHPGDLKTALTTVLLSVTAKARDALNSANGKKAVTALKVVEKKQAKK